MTQPTPRRAMTMREIREGLGHVKPGEPEPLVQVTRYEVSVLPEDDINRSVFTVNVEFRGTDRWAVVRHGWCLDSNGGWDYELRPSEREDDWLESHRFDLDTALRLAREAAPGLIVNGHTAVEAYQRTHPVSPVAAGGVNGHNA